MTEEDIPFAPQVLLSDLEVIRAALASAYYQNVTLDLLDKYRKLNQRENPSALTKSLQGAIGIIEQYLALEEDVPE